MDRTQDSDFYIDIIEKKRDGVKIRFIKKILYQIGKK